MLHWSFCFLCAVGMHGEELSGCLDFARTRADNMTGHVPLDLSSLGTWLVISSSFLSLSLWFRFSLKNELDLDGSKSMVADQCKTKQVPVG